MNKNNIILVGLMGAGKTSVGKYLTSLIKNYSFVDTDEYIESEEEISVSEIFNRYTEAGFRRIEEESIAEITKQSDNIISTGGGAFESDTNRQHLLNSGKVFYLYAAPDVLYNRIKTDTNRPLLQNENPKDCLQKLFEKRDINYRKADYIIDTTNSTIEECANEILRRLYETGFIS